MATHGIDDDDVLGPQLMRTRFGLDDQQTLNRKEREKKVFISERVRKNCTNRRSLF